MKFSDLKEDWQIKCSSNRAAVAIQKLIKEESGKNIDFSYYGEDIYFLKKKGWMMEVSYCSPYLPNKYKAKDFLTQNSSTYEIY